MVCLPALHSSLHSVLANFSCSTVSCRSCSFANPHSPVPSLCADSVNRMRCCSSSCSETAFLPNTGAGQAFRFRFRSFILPIAVADERSTSWRPIQFVRQRCCGPRSPSPPPCSLLASPAVCCPLCTRWTHNAHERWLESALRAVGDYARLSLALVSNLCLLKANLAMRMLLVTFRAISR